MKNDTTETKILDAMIRYNGADMRRVNHAIKVWAYALAIAERENCDDRTRKIVSCAAILHDIGIHEAERKHGSNAGPYQEMEGPAIVRELLASIPELEIPADMLERIVYLVGHHHTYSAIDGTDFRILVEADFIVNADEDRMDSKAIAAMRQKIFRTAGALAMIDTFFA
jgi:HD superfamily phosphohydrolase